MCSLLFACTTISSGSATFGSRWWFVECQHACGTAAATATATATETDDDKDGCRSTARTRDTQER